jgi:prepilin-type N-terminal cleavage/methylation domain-containing protein
MNTKAGMTLIELLIVVAVMSIMMGIALPMAKTGIDGARTRAAAEIVREQFRAAHAVAALTGKPAAVVLLVKALAVGVPAGLVAMGIKSGLKARADEKASPPVALPNDTTPTKP